MPLILPHPITLILTASPLLMVAPFAQHFSTSACQHFSISGSRLEKTLNQ